MARRTLLPALAAAVALMLAGCGGSGSSSPTGAAGSASPGGSGSTGSSSTTSAGVVDGVRLTAQGSQLSLGQTAKVSWQPTGKKAPGVAAISVTRLQKMPISVFSSWRLGKATRRSTPYFVHATVRNLGHSNLSGTVVPLYLLAHSNTLLEPSTFQAQYARCPSRPLPAKFVSGKRTSVCLVYFVPAHGTMSAISFRPTGDFDAITWQGKVHRGH